MSYGKHSPKRWPGERDRRRWRATEPLTVDGARTLATAVIHQATALDLADPAQVMPVAAWLLDGDVLPDEGPVSRRTIVPKGLRAVEAIMAGQELSHRRRKSRLPEDHRPRLEELLRKHQGTPVNTG